MKNFRKNISVIVCSVVLAMVSCLPYLAMASEVKFEPATGNFRSNTPLSVKVILDTHQKKVNVVSAEIVLPNNVSVEVSDGNSVISNFISPPTVIGNKVKFAGIIPGGYSGADGLLVTLLINSPSGTVPVNFTSLPQILLHDGQGTKDGVTVMAAELKFSPEGDLVEQIADTVPPESFIVQITKDRALYDGKYVAIFATQDKGSGIDHYEILEGKSYNTGEWQTVVSPYVLKDQTRSSYIYVKAVDKAGNERLASVSPAYTASFTERMIPPTLTLLFILALFTVWRIMTHRHMIKPNLLNNHQ